MRKVVMLGDSGVGKTALRIKLSGHELTPELPPTKGIEFGLAIQQCGDFSECFQLWDISGSERSTQVIDPLLCELTSMIFLVWDAARPETHEHLRSELALILKKFPDPENKNLIQRNLPIIFICNKIDLLEREVEIKIADWEKEFGLTRLALVRVSAKGDKGVKELLDKAIELVNIPIPEPKKKNMNELDYKFHPFKHTRLVRYESLKDIFDKNNDSSLPRRELIWFFMHLASIEDINSKTALWIKKAASLGLGEQEKNFIFGLLRRANDEQRATIFCKLFKPLAGKSKELLAIMELLSLLDEKETTIFGFKLFCREVGREKNQNEMLAILTIARRIYQECFLEPGSRESVRERLLVGFDHDKNSLPRAVQKIVDQYAPAPKVEKPQHSVCALL